MQAGDLRLQVADLLRGDGEVVAHALRRRIAVHRVGRVDGAGHMSWSQMELPSSQREGSAGSSQIAHEC